MSHLAFQTYEVTRDNDIAFHVPALDEDPITGVDPDTGDPVVYGASEVDGWFAAEEDSDTALGAEKQFQAVSEGRFVPFFDAEEVNDALDDLEDLLQAPPRHGHPFFLILKGPSDFRIAIDLRYRKARRV